MKEKGKENGAHNNQIIPNKWKNKMKTNKKNKKNNRNTYNNRNHKRRCKNKLKYNAHKENT